MRTPDPTRDLRRAIKRLTQSDTYITRRNARQAFDAEIKAIVEQYHGKYPKLRKDGTAIIPRKPKGACCPVCKVPFREMRMLVDHIMEKHGDRHIVTEQQRATRPKGTPTNLVCKCGRIVKGRSGMAKHWSGVKGGVGPHLVNATIAAANKERR